MRLTFTMLTLLSILAMTLPPTTAGDFGIAPLRLEFATPPGKLGTQALQVHNGSDRPVTITLSVKDFVRLPNGQDLELDPGTSERGCSEWLIVSPRVVHLAPHERQQVRVSMNVPEAAEGTYWAFIFAEQTSDIQPRQANHEDFSMQVTVKPRWCIRVHQTVPETLKPAGRIVHMARELGADEQAGVMTVAFENTGNNLLRCQGYVEIRDGRGETVRSVQLDGNGIFSVYPGATRKVAALQEPLPPGDYMALAIVDYGAEALIAGELAFKVE